MSYYPFTDHYEASKFQSLKLLIEKEFIAIDDDGINNICRSILNKERSYILWNFVATFVRKTDSMDIYNNATIVRCLYEHLAYHPCLIIRK